MVEVCGGSRQLLRILNRLGCTSSPDTHDRFVTQHAEARCQKQIWDEIPKNVFTVASVDNFDMLQSYSAVYCGDQQRSYHGTTIQLVQPSPGITIPLTTLPDEVNSPVLPITHPPRADTGTQHWLRSCWVSQMWQNSPCHDLYSSIPLPEHSGWIHHSDGTYAIDWEAPEI